MNVKMKRQIQHLWFIKELLRKILTIAVAKVFFSENVTSWTLQNLSWQFYRICSEPPSCQAVDRIFYRNSCEMWNETIPMKIYSYKGIQIKSICQDLYSIMLIFQTQGYYSVVLSAWNYSQEIITKTSKEWNLLER